MKKSLGKTIGAVILSAAFAVTGCNKEQTDASVANSVNASDQTQVVFNGLDTIPKILKVPRGNRLKKFGYATGVQIYQVQRSITDPNVFSWVNIAPAATLYNAPDFTDQFAIHYAGPTWEFTKGPNTGTKVVATKLQAVTETPTAISWLLLKAVDSLSSPDNKITYVQRLYTAGGLAPTRGANKKHLGELDSIPYTAIYFFYVARN